MASSSPLSPLGQENDPENEQTQVEKEMEPEQKEQEAITECCLEAFRKYIVETVDFRDLMFYKYFSLEQRRHFRTLEKIEGGQNVTARMVDEILAMKDKPDKYSELIRLFQDESINEKVLRILKGEMMPSNFKAHKDRLQKVMKIICENMHVGQMLDQLLLHNLILTREAEQLKNTEKNLSKHDAAMDLVLLLPNRREDWFVRFMMCLVDSGQETLAKIADKNTFSQIKMHRQQKMAENTAKSWSKEDDDEFCAEFGQQSLIPVPVLRQSSIQERLRSSEETQLKELYKGEMSLDENIQLNHVVENEETTAKTVYNNSSQFQTLEAEVLTGIFVINSTMETSLNKENEKADIGDKLDHCKFLKERQNQNLSREKIVEDSRERYSKNRQNSADASNLSRSQKERKHDNFLENKRKHVRRRGKKKLTIADVSNEATKILEDFLQGQLAEGAIQTNSTENQRYVEVSVTENKKTTPSGDSSSYLASSSNILREDSIPYADESDNEIRKAESLPHENLVENQGIGIPKGLPVHHEKSRSAPYTGNEVDWQQRPNRKFPGTMYPTPPAPPGTPHSPSENSSNESGLLLQPVPFTAKATDSSKPCSSDTLYSLGKPHSHVKNVVPPAAPDTLNLPSPPRFHSHSATHITDGEGSSGSPVKHSSTRPAYLKKSGSVSSSDTDSTHDKDGRKKKKMFKKAQHRVQTFLFKKKHVKEGKHEMDIDEEDGHAEKKNKIKTKPKKKHNKHEEEMDVGIDMPDNYVPHDDKVAEERHIHKNKHIHQTHSGEDRKMVLRSEEVSVVDIEYSKEKKHIEKNWKMKESSGQKSHHSGFLGKIRRFTSRDKGKKPTITESKSAHFVRDEADSNEGRSKYSRGTSVPGGSTHHSRPRQLGLDGTDDATLKMYSDRRGSEYSTVKSDESQPWFRQTSATQFVYRDEDKIKRHSSHLDIIDHSGNMIERLYLDAEGKELPKNKSFSFVEEEDVTERVIDDHGHRRRVRDVTHPEHVEYREDYDGEGIGFDDMTEEEKDQLYGQIASRLASIRDHLMSEKEEQSRSDSASAGSKLTDDQKSSPEEEFTKSTLTPLEVELRDELRKFGADRDAMMKSNARQTALHISGLATYNHFKNVVQESVGQGQGWAQIAAVFQVTKQAMQLAGSSGALALQIREMSLRYIEDSFASWIVGQGGWESMLLEGESDSELD